MFPSQDNPCVYVKSLIDQMKKDVDRLVGETAKHQLIEKAQIEKLRAATAGGEAPGIETAEAEAIRENNKLALQTRRREVEEVVQLAVTMHSQEEKDHTVVTEVFKISQASASKLEKAQTRTLEIVEGFNQLYTEIDNTRKTAREQIAQSKQNPTTNTGEELEGTLNTLRSQTQRLEGISEAATKYNEELNGFKEELARLVAQAGLPVEVPIENTIFQDIDKQLEDSYATWEDKADAIRVAAGRILLARRSHVQSKWESLIGNTNQGNTALQAIDFAEHATLINTHRGREKREDTDPHKNEDVHMRRRRENK